jgi:hypothetical protein
MSDAVDRRMAKELPAWLRLDKVVGPRFSGPALGCLDFPDRSDRSSASLAYQRQARVS